MTEKKIIAVVGATGSQGGGLARAILDDPNGPFTLRAITRDVHAPRARELAARGAEVVEADLDDEASVRRAFDGAYGAFVVTNFWAQLTPEQEAARSRAQMEKDQAEIAARAAKAAGLKHVVWSTLEDTRPHFEHADSSAPTLEGGYKVPHFDAKGEANAYFTAQGVPTTFLETTFYYESLLQGQGPIRDENGELVLTLAMGDSPLSLVAVEDIGRTAYGIFLAGSRYVGRTVGLAGAHYTGAELADLLTTVLGEKVSYRPLTHDQVRASGFPIADEIAGTFQFYTEAADSFVAHRDLDAIRKINPRLKPLEEWLTEHRDQLAA
ncbi:NmrA/HSCARG family protein [Paractinoplanes globisporus]|uniref:NmrA/HSCARG family protein n=1 Tax=Paractinoplanes globisporus TaxID=113565 RepID=A0ABW6WKT1_9ACTN|nr:NmrA/HSCARG family protein [Actinoplanes globisporus]